MSKEVTTAPGLTSLAQDFMAEEAGRRPLAAEEMAELQERHRAIRIRVERLLGGCALARHESSSLHPGGDARPRYYEHHWRAPVQIGNEGAYRVRDEATTMYAQIGACTLRDCIEVEYYEIRAYGVLQDMKPETGPRWPFAPQFGQPVCLEAGLRAALVQADVDRVDFFAECLTQLERATPA